MYVAFSALGLAVSLAVGSKKLSKEHEVTKTGLAEEEKKRLENKELKQAHKREKNGVVAPKEDV